MLKKRRASSFHGDKIHTKNQPPPQPLKYVPVKRTYVTQSHCYTVTQSHCYTVTQSHCYTVA